MAAVHQQPHARTRSARIAANTNTAKPFHDRPVSSLNATLAAASSGGSGGSGSINRHGPPAIAIFLTNLRLLDLDLLPDWPSITTDTFAAATSSAATQGHKKRVHCVEWSLFQLFSIWDAEETRNKLKPFYPPLDQVQSINLRAALLRGLEQAKKNGVLGRDAILRKTMLDECKGERLEEVLASFSTAVLKKVVGDDMNASQQHPALAVGLAFENRGYKGERMELDILNLAHRVKLRRMLERKDAARARYRDFSDLMGIKERNLARRREEVRAKEEDPARGKLSDEARLEMRRTVRNNWTGDEHWAEALLYGNAGTQQDRMLSMPFDRVWRRVQQDRLAEVEENSGGLLEQLETRVRMQKERLNKWDRFRKETFGEPSREASSKQQAAGRAGQGIDFGFGAHEALQLGKTNPSKGTLNVKMHDEYAQLVESLNDSLANSGRKQAHDPLSFLKQYTSREKREVKHKQNLSVSSVGADGAISDLSEFEEDADVAAPAPPIKSFQSKLEAGKRLPVRPKLSPAEHSSAQSSIFLSQLQKPILSANKDFEIEIPSLSRPESPPKEVVEEPTRPRHRTPTPEQQTYESPDDLPDIPPSPTQDLADKILEDINNASPSPSRRAKPRHTLSLAERTRLSMARGSNLFLADDEPDLPSPSPPPDPSMIAGETPTPPSGGGDNTRQLSFDPTEDLVSRTRRSMVGFEKAKQKAQLERRRSQRRSKVPPRREGSYFPSVSEETQDQTMLMEELGEEDMEAIFRSRPKIKASPVPSPTKEWEDDDYFPS
ncbi:hypothetical protein HJFPF1_09439 [Paramyrothecium foliicola]|nr:hypothetical protein HJFPF1_09439 [Paramyrothecium foliicola]